PSSATASTCPSHRKSPANNCASSNAQPREPERPPEGRTHRSAQREGNLMTLRRALVATIAFSALAGGGAWWWLARGKPIDSSDKKSAPVAVTTAQAVQRDVPVRLRANGSVVALQSIDIRAQITSTV